MAEATAAVHYISPTEANVAVATSAEGATGEAMELTLFALYAGHLLADLGPKGWAKDFTDTLVQEVHGALGESEVLGVHVTPHEPSDDARASFDGRLLRPDTIDDEFFELRRQRDWQLRYHAKPREHFRSRHYFMTSIAVLFHHLLQANESNRAQRDRLTSAGIYLAAANRAGRLRLPIKWTDYAVAVAHRAWFEASNEP